MWQWKQSKTQRKSFDSKQILFLIKSKSISLPFSRASGRRRLGRVTGFCPGDSEGFSHGWSKCSVFSFAFLAGQSQNIVFVPAYFGSYWTVSAFPTSILPPAFPQHTGTWHGTAFACVFMQAIWSLITLVALIIRTKQGILQRLHHVTTCLEFFKDYFYFWDPHFVAILPPSGTSAIFAVANTHCTR